MVEPNPIFTLMPFIVFAIIAILAMAMVAFWVWMLIDCIQSESSEGNDKLIWVLVLLFTHWLGAIIYYFVRRRPRRLGGGRPANYPAAIQR